MKSKSLSLYLLIGALILAVAAYFLAKHEVKQEYEPEEPEDEEIIEDRPAAPRKKRKEPAPEPELVPVVDDITKPADNEPAK